MEDEEELSELEIIRAESVKFMQHFFKEHMSEIDESVNELNSLTTRPQRAAPRRKPGKDETFRFSGHIPLQRRKSRRLALLDPTHYSDQLQEADDDKENKKSKYDDHEDMEEVVYKRKKSYKVSRASYQAIPLQVIDESYIRNISYQVSKKQYSPVNGTSCHQCRQKTLDSKTICKSGRCVGVRGQFCGVCLQNRYGEDAADALRKPGWSCPPCRGVCNCSICRTRQGKRPTGIMSHIAQKYGHKSVEHYLRSLQGLGDYAEEAASKEYKDGDLLGLSANGRAFYIATEDDSTDLDLKGFINDKAVVEAAC